MLSLGMPFWPKKKAQPNCHLMRFVAEKHKHIHTHGENVVRRKWMRGKNRVVFFYILLSLTPEISREYLFHFLFRLFYTRKTTNWCCWRRMFAMIDIISQPAVFVMHKLAAQWLSLERQNVRLEWTSLFFQAKYVCIQLVSCRENIPRVTLRGEVNRKPYKSPKLWCFSL